MRLAPDFAEHRARVRATRWLHPGYGTRHCEEPLRRSNPLAHICTRDETLVGYASLTHPTISVQFSNSGASAFSRHDLRQRWPSTTRGCREDRVRAAPAVSCANMHKKTHTSIQVQRRHPAFPAQWFYGLLRALPGDRAFLPPSSARSFASRQLDASVGASEPHGFAVRRSHARQSQLSRPPHPTARS